MKPSLFLRSVSATTALAVGLAASLVKPSHAGGPIGLCGPGAPLLWPGGGVGIPFNPDQGNLGPSLNNAAAVALVQSAFDVWTAVPSSTVSYSNAGLLPVDVDITNFAPYLSPSSPDGLSAIVFDDTGEIFDLLFGPGSGILGFAGPEWIDPSTCTILEGVSFLNGPAFTDPVYAFDVMVHEFGHYSGLGHTVVNGQVYIGDSTGPTPDSATFGPPPDPFVQDVVETMYPFYFGPGIGTGSPERDDIAAISTLYPEPAFLPSTASIQGVILAPNGTTRLTGVNVIARNIADPFNDAVSAISGDYSTSGGDPFAGLYTLRGLTPGASYAVFIDQILAGGFSTAPITIPAAEEFYNGPAESNNLTTPDNPLSFTPVSAAAGVTTTGINVILNAPRPGDPLPLADDGSVELFLPFPVKIVGQTFNSVWVNANGNLSFGAAAGSFIPSTPEFLDGPPRIAGLWRDLNPEAGGSIFFTQTASSFTVWWKNVPAFPDVGANTFSIILRKPSVAPYAEVAYGALSATDGIAGLSGGYAATAGTETPVDLRTPSSKPKTQLGLAPQAAIFEVFGGANPVDVAGKTVLYENTFDYTDAWAGANNSFATAHSISLPFESSSTALYTEIEPVGGDVDFFKFTANAGDVIKVEITRGAFDSVAGLFAPDGSLVAVDDDNGVGLLSKLDYLVPVSGTYAVAVSAYSDFGFTGAGSSGGRYVLKIRNAAPTPAGPANWVRNGGFESGDFFPWIVVETGPPFLPLSVVDSSAGGYFGPAQPQEGSLEAFGGFDGGGPMQIALLQDVTIPAGEPFLTLEWKDRLQWELFAGPTLERTYAVLVFDPVSNALLRVVHLLTTGVDPAYADTGWVSHSLDLSEFIGQTIRLMFYQDIPESFTGPGQFELDDVRLRSQ